MQIIPSVLVNTFEEFAGQVRSLEGYFDLLQIDVMDGEFVDNISFGEIEKINDLAAPIYYELHLMVKNPLAEMKKWSDIKNIKRVIFHVEAGDPTEAINYAHGHCWQVGLALNPETPVEKLAPYVRLIDEVLFLMVHPGHQHGEFIPAVGDKIKQFKKLYPAVPIAVDGGLNKDNLAEVKAWGVEIFCIGSALTMAADVEKAYRELINILKN